MSEDISRYNLIMVDGYHSSACIAHAVKLFRLVGILYLDNSDKDSTSRSDDMRLDGNSVVNFAIEKMLKYSIQQTLHPYSYLFNKD